VKVNIFVWYGNALSSDGLFSAILSLELGMASFIALSSNLMGNRSNTTRRKEIGPMPIDDGETPPSSGQAPQIRQKT
jgi:hypothetical protein